MTTRGLFVNTLTNEIVIRAYDKFFNVGEMRQTEYGNLRDNLTFPVTAWVKENGYLGLVGYDDAAGDIVISSKSTTEGEFAEWFKDIFERRIARDRQFVVDFLRDNNVTLLFEVILPRNDPHIIDYTADDIVLLDIVKRQREYEALSDAAREAFGARLGIRCKQKAAVLHDWYEFEGWYERSQGIDYTYNDARVEGFVLEDAAGWHVKMKLDYYIFWKQMRTALDAIKKGKTAKVAAHSAYPDMAEAVIAYMVQLPREYIATATIGEIRRGFSDSVPTAQ